MSSQFEQLRREVLRRVRYATNTIALRDNRPPPEAPYDTAVTNGIVAIGTEAWPGEKVTSNGRMKAARDLQRMMLHQLGVVGASEKSQVHLSFL